MTNLDIPILHSHDSADSVPLQYLGAALVMNWGALPDDARATIYKMATGVPIVGLPHAVNLSEDIDRLIRNNSRRKA